jgi:hypothetical protein
MNHRESTLAKLVNSIHAHMIVSELTRDPDPEPKHEYQRSPHSGAGNCVCGAAERHRRHPHGFIAADSKPELCTCGLPCDAKCHQLTGDAT